MFRDHLQTHRVSPTETRLKRFLKVRLTQSRQRMLKSIYSFMYSPSSGLNWPRCSAHSTQFPRQWHKSVAGRNKNRRRRRRRRYQLPMWRVLEQEIHFLFLVDVQNVRSDLLRIYATDLCRWRSPVKLASVGTGVNVQNAEAGSGPTKSYTWKSKSTSNCIIWMC